MIIKPMTDHVLIRMVDTEGTTKSGLILPTAAKDRPVIAEVLSVGTGYMDDGTQVDMQVSIGDKVLTSKYSGDKYRVGDEELTVVRMKDILAIVEE